MSHGRYRTTDHTAGMECRTVAIEEQKVTLKTGPNRNPYLNALPDLKVQEQWLGSIKNIHLYIFCNLNFVFSVLICRSSVFCILALGSGQRLLYRLGSGLVLVLVLRFCAYSYGGVCS